MERVVSPELSQNEVNLDVKLRPSNFDEYIGQRRVVENIEVMVKSALKRKAAMDHVLLSGLQVLVKHH